IEFNPTHARVGQNVCIGTEPPARLVVAQRWESPPAVRIRSRDVKYGMRQTAGSHRNKRLDVPASGPIDGNGQYLTEGRKGVNVSGRRQEKKDGQAGLDGIYDSRC